MKQKLKRISILTDEIREDFIHMYFKRAKLMFKVRFLSIRIKEEADSRIEEYTLQISKNEKKLGIRIESS